MQFFINVGCSSIGYSEITLPACIAGIGFSETLCDRQVGGIRLQRVGKIALRALDAADFAVEGLEIALPAEVAWIG
jgi:hypothetical protein